MRVAHDPLLLDIGAVPECHCDSALEHLFKALAQDPRGEPESIWAPHENPWLTEIVETATARMQAILVRIQDTLSRLLTGEGMDELRKAASPGWGRWSETQFEAARRQLEGKRADDYTLEDWLLVVDYLLHRYLPPDVITSEADYLAVRSTLAGKIQGALSGTPRLDEVDPGAIVQLVPTRFAHVPERVLTPVERQTLLISQARAAENISALTESARHRMKGLIIEHVQAQVLGQKEGQYTALRQRLFDEFGQLNRDFRRIAITEAGECCNTGFIAAQPIGQKVKRMEAYRGACDFCKSINGKVFTVIAADAPEKNGETEVWPGKTNIGRSSSARRRVGGQLMERTPNERWWPAAGVQHPNCRGAWVRVTTRPNNVDPAFADWMDELIKKSGPTTTSRDYE